MNILAIITIFVNLIANVSTTVVSDPATVSLSDEGQLIINDPLDAVTIITNELEHTIMVFYQ